MARPALLALLILAAAAAAAPIAGARELPAVLDAIDARRDEFVSQLMAYVSRPSISAQNVGVREVAELLVAQMAEMGMEARAVPTDGHPVVVGTYGADPEKVTLLVYGHYDVQPPDPLDAWLSPPFEPTVRDGRIYARGVGDNKGQHGAALYAVATWMDVHGALPCNLIVVLEGEEEIGSPRLLQFVTEHRDELRAADLVVTFDGPKHQTGAPVVSFGVRGGIKFGAPPHARPHARTPARSLARTLTRWLARSPQTSSRARPTAMRTPAASAASCPTRCGRSSTSSGR